MCEASLEPDTKKYFLCTLKIFGSILKLNLGGDRFSSQKSRKTAKNRRFIGPLEKFSHQNLNRSPTNLSLLIPHIMSTFEQVLIYGLGGYRF
jgi:hypothetical protein